MYTNYKVLIFLLMIPAISFAKPNFYYGQQVVVKECITDECYFLKLKGTHVRILSFSIYYGQYMYKVNPSTVRYSDDHIEYSNTTVYNIMEKELQ